MPLGARIRGALLHHWTGQLLSAALLPGWLLLLAASAHASDVIAAIAKQMLVGITIVAGLLVVGLWLWSRDRASLLQEQIKAGARPVQNRDERSSSVWSLLGGAAFLAAGWQVLMDFNLFTPIFADLGFNLTSAWDTLLGLSAIQVVCFFAHNRWLNRP
ncbi:hypothetical protein D8I30_08435 [Brevundimonas naejangsanensis]|uniref:Uncharacterized protein n=1 Tax=Brevundimonas naejangsanensis TaxID=588932 RepID=A0A494RJL8_9CAUL|nr:hypothetical protein [Brevundimonas naejangsanensis]AYG95203.1 hypothetical protein D8I30_08435 [Brevundimonas naejangsanensis]